jgi:uncharacterized protein YuzE
MAQMMHLDYDKEADVLYVTLGKPRKAISRDVGDDVLLRLDPETGEVVGMTLLNLSSREVQDIMPIVMRARTTAV